MYHEKPGPKVIFFLFLFPLFLLLWWYGHKKTIKKSTIWQSLNAVQFFLLNSFQITMFKSSSLLINMPSVHPMLHCISYCFFEIWKQYLMFQFSFTSVQFSPSVVFDSLQPHESQHVRPFCPSPSRRVHSNSRPSSSWCYPVISSSVVPFSSCPQSLAASGSFPMSQLFASGGQSTGVSALVSVLPKNIQGWSPLEWTDGSPCSPRDSQESSPTPQFKIISSLLLSFLHSPTLTSIHDHWENHSLD